MTEAFEQEPLDENSLFRHISSHAKLGNAREAFALIDEYEERLGYVAPSALYVSVLSECDARLGVRALSDLHDTHPDNPCITPDMCAALLSKAKRESQKQLGMQVVAIMVERGLLSDEISASNLVQSFTTAA